jgi:hypothetical protein
VGVDDGRLLAPPTAPRDLTVGLTFPDLLVAALNGVVPRKNS